MRIFHHPKIYKIIPLLAREMINIEYGKMVYDKMTILPYPWKDYIILEYKKTGVEYGIHTREGVICLPSSYNEDINISNIISNLTKELKIVKKELENFPFKLVPIANSEYQLSGISFYVEDDCIGVKDRTIINATSPQATGDKYLYKWRIGWHKDNIKLLDFGSYRLKEIILGVSCIIWDPENKFILEDMSLRCNFPTTADLAICNKISTSIIRLHPIFGVKWHIFNDAWEGHNMNFYQGIVYDESFDNVNLLRLKAGSIDKKTRIKMTMIKLQILLNPAAVGKNNKTCIGLPEAKIDDDEYCNDICHICETKLYDDIYVLEVVICNNKPHREHTIYFGLCSICGSDVNLITQNLSLLKPKQWKILRVMYPRTFKEVLELYNYSANDINVLNYLYVLQQKKHTLIYNKNNSISGNKIHSIENAQKLISGEYKKYEYLFRYAWYDDRAELYRCRKVGGGII